jgi:hypothetical protein
MWNKIENFGFRGVSVSFRIFSERERIESERERNYITVLFINKSHLVPLLSPCGEDVGAIYPQANLRKKIIFPEHHQLFFSLHSRRSFIPQSDAEMR